MKTCLFLTNIILSTNSFSEPSGCCNQHTHHGNFSIQGKKENEDNNSWNSWKIQILKLMK
jgi:hypothetical protein